MNQMISSVTIDAELVCRMGCAACCIAPSISSPIPEMPNGKAAGERCVQLDSAGLCKIFGQPERPAVCSSLKATASMCGANASEAMAYLTELERLTA
jgi:Fe-S-cluster containining protein